MNKDKVSGKDVSSTIQMLEKQLYQLKKRVIEWKWMSVEDDGLPPENVGVLVFIHEEDNHITSGMWDVSKKWVLLDEYRVPECEVTHWMKLPPEPTDNRKSTKNPYTNPLAANFFEDGATEQAKSDAEKIRQLEERVRELEEKLGQR